MVIHACHKAELKVLIAEVCLAKGSHVVAVPKGVGRERKRPNASNGAIGRDLSSGKGEEGEDSS